MRALLPNTATWLGSWAQGQHADSSCAQTCTSMHNVAGCLYNLFRVDDAITRDCAIQTLSPEYRGYVWSECHRTPILECIGYNMTHDGPQHYNRRHDIIMCACNGVNLAEKSKNRGGVPSSAEQVACSTPERQSVKHEAGHRPIPVGRGQQEGAGSTSEGVSRVYAHGRCVYLK